MAINICTKNNQSVEIRWFFWSKCSNSVSNPQIYPQLLWTKNCPIMVTDNNCCSVINIFALLFTIFVFLSDFVGLYLILNLSH